MLEAGTIAPDFTLPNESGEPISLAELLAGGPLVLYFYPGDFTPICTREACMLRDIHAELQSAGLRVAGVSPDAPTIHAQFRQQHRLPFTLLADTDRTVTRLYAACGPLGIGIRRISYLINARGIIDDAVLADLKISRHRAFVRKALAQEIAHEPASAGSQP